MPILTTCDLSKGIQIGLISTNEQRQCLLKLKLCVLIRITIRGD